MTKRLQEIRERESKATAGPWVTDDVARVGVGEPYGPFLATCKPSVHDWPVRQQEQDDAEFIAHAREDVPWLLSEMERLETARQEAQESYNAAKGELTNMQAELKAMAEGGA